jgi:hypothetical protein
VNSRNIYEVPISCQALRHTGIKKTFPERRLQDNGEGKHQHRGAKLPGTQRARKSRQEKGVNVYIPVRSKSLTSEFIHSFIQQIINFCSLSGIRQALNSFSLYVYFSFSLTKQRSWRTETHFS